MKKYDDNIAQITSNEALTAFHELRRQAANVSETTLDEINAEITEVRSERRKNFDSQS